METGSRNEEPAYANDGMSRTGESSAPRAHGGSVERSLEWVGGGLLPVCASLSLRRLQCGGGGGGQIIGA